MPHIPQRSRPIPPGAVGSRSVAPSDPMTSMGVGLPTDMKRNADKPVVEKRSGPRRRTLSKASAKDKLSMAKWDINPFKIMDDM